MDPTEKIVGDCNMTRRSQALEKAVEQYLRLKKVMFLRIENYRCFRCGQVQNSKAKGFPDFFCYSPILLAIECKTGKGQLSGEQKIVKMAMLENNIDYLVVRDTTDNLLKYFGDKR